MRKYSTSGNPDAAWTQVPKSGPGVPGVVVIQKTCFRWDYLASFTTSPSPGARKRFVSRPCWRAGTAKPRSQNRDLGHPDLWSFQRMLLGIEDRGDAGSLGGAVPAGRCPM